MEERRVEKHKEGYKVLVQAFLMMGCGGGSGVETTEAEGILEWGRGLEEDLRRREARSSVVIRVTRTTSTMDFGGVVCRRFLKDWRSILSHN